MKFRALLNLASVATALTFTLHSMPATAGYTVVSGTGSQSLSSVVETFDTLTPGSTSATVLPSGILINFAGNSMPVVGSSAGLYGAPVLSGSDGLHFGAGGTTQANGPDATVYLTAGSNPAAGITLTMPGPQTFFGMLWGSVDAFDYLTFYNGVTKVASLDGTMVNSVAGPQGDSSANGTSYVNVLFSGGTTYDRVTFTSPSYAFEFDDVAITGNTAIPEPVSLAVLGSGIIALGLLRRVRARNADSAA